MSQNDRTTGLVGNAGMKVPVRAATTAAITLSGEQTIDGVACVTDDRVLVKDQASGVNNGIYVVDTGTWERSKDADGPYDFVEGSVVKVNQGSTNQGFWYLSTTGTITPGTTSLTFAKASTVLAVVSAFVQTLLDDADADAFLATLGGGARLCEGRLTLTSGTAVTISDVTAAETVYFTPFKGNRVDLYDGSKWVRHTFTELTLDVPDADQMNDVFIYNNSGTLTLEAVAWTNDTNRATALATQDGVYVKTGATGRRYLGSFRSTTAGNGQTEDSLAKRWVWNYYNRMSRPMRVLEGTDTWNYTTATIRQANGSGANQLDFVVGVTEDIVEATILASARNTDVGVQVSVGIGFDSTSTFVNGYLSGRTTTPVANVAISLLSSYRALVTPGRHVFYWNEYSAATGTTTWLGDSGAPTLEQSGISGSIWG